MLKLGKLPKWHNRYIDSALDDMESWSFYIIRGGFALSISLYALLPFEYYKFDVLTIIPYLDPSNMELLSVLAYGTVGAILSELGLRRLLGKGLSKREYNQMRPYLWLFVMALTYVIFNKAIYAVNWLFGGLIYSLINGAYISFIFDVLALILFLILLFGKLCIKQK